MVAFGQAPADRFAGADAFGEPGGLLRAAGHPCRCRPQERLAVRDGDGQIPAGDRTQQPHGLGEVAALGQDVVGAQSGGVEDMDGAVGELLPLVEPGERLRGEGAVLVGGEQALQVGCGDHRPLTRRRCPASASVSSGSSRR